MDKQTLRKYFIYMVLLLVVLLLINRGWAFFKENESDKKSDNSLAEVYNAYTLSGMRAAREKVFNYAEILYNKDVAEGKTDKKFRGFTRIDYCSKAIAKYKEEINSIDELAYYLPLFFIAMVLFALFVSMSFGLRAIRPLDFEQRAISFKN